MNDGLYLVRQYAQILSADINSSRTMEFTFNSLHFLDKIAKLSTHEIMCEWDSLP